MRSLVQRRAPFLAVAALTLACGGSDSATSGGPPASAGGGGSAGASAGGTSAGGAKTGGATAAGATASGHAGTTNAGSGGAKTGGGNSAGGAAGAATGGGTNGGNTSAGNTNGGSLGGGNTNGGALGGGNTNGGATAGGQGGAPAGGSAGNGGAGGACANCHVGYLCKYDACIPNLGTCTTNDDCVGDAYCDADGQCIPYGVPTGKTNDADCQKPHPPNGVTPVVQCEWTGDGGAGGTSPYNYIYTTPMVADLNLDGDPNKLQPSIIVTTWRSLDTKLQGGAGGTTDHTTRIGMLRVFDGRTCQEQMRIGGPDDPDKVDTIPSYSGMWAIGDLDGDVGTGPDGHPEIVGLHRIGAGIDDSDIVVPIAYKIVKDAMGKPQLAVDWIGRDCNAAGEPPVTVSNNGTGLGAGLWDLNDDGVPEVLYDGDVFDAKGCLITTKPGIGTNYSTVADVDLDGLPDLVRYDGIYGWDKTGAGKWVLKPWVNQTSALLAGYVAVVDVGAYSTIPGKTAADPLPEVVVVSANSPASLGGGAGGAPAGGSVRIQTLTGEVVFGPFDVYGTGNSDATDHGGPPTASDFDGDGQVEFATAGAYSYSIYDPDCLTADQSAARPGGKCDRSAAAASLPQGILWSQPSQDKSSGVTGSSVFDFDGDGASEAVYSDECFVRVYHGADGTVIFSAAASSGTGYENPVIADVDGDFATEIVVARTANSNCPKTDPLNLLATVPSANSTGFVVYQDPKDLWANSRPIWNQHAYSITNVNDDATIPKASDLKNNWQQPGLNNFRQNAQGKLGAFLLADLTVELTNADQLCSGIGGTVQVDATVCNRGTNPVQDGALVAFTTGKDNTGTPICSTTTSTLLGVGDCTNVSCSGAIAPQDDVYVSVDPDHAIADCHPGNNLGASSRIVCGKP